MKHKDETNHQNQNKEKNLEKKSIPAGNAFSSHRDYIKSQRKKGKSGALTFGMETRFDNACLAEWIAPEKHKNEVLDWMKNGKHFLVLLGMTGVGKTYFCAALLNYFWDFGEEVYYTNSRHFFQKIQQAIRENGNQYYVIQNLAEKDILIIDDIGAGTNTEWQQEMLLELIDLRYNSQKPTVVTSNLKFEEIKEILGARIHSRLRASENLILGIWDKDRRFMKKIEE